tara:strand:- start:6 stop:230 length:225 start_codon:yes stop_codon:yes gene_type:complete
MGMLKVFAGLAFLSGGVLILGTLSTDYMLLAKFWDDALLIICGGVLLLALDKLILILEEIRNYLKKFSETIGKE